MNRIALPSILLALAAALALAGCGGDGGEAGGGYGSQRDGAAETAVAPNPEEGATFVSVAAVPELGRVLVDSRGLTLYSFERDQGAEPSCYGECAAAWPPLLSDGDPHASNGAIPAKVGSTERRDGSVQVTYAGRPLYTYAQDQAPGDAGGEGVVSFGGEWLALTPSGAAAGAAAPPASN